MHIKRFKVEDNQESYQAYIKSFNTAYTIHKHMPELAKQLAKSLDDVSLQSEGFRDGIEQSEIDSQKNLPKFLRNERLNSFKENNEQLKGKNKGDIDKE